MRVIKKRQTGISLGDGGDDDMLRRIRGHANFSEYVPLCLILIGILEYLGGAFWVIHSLGAVLLIARLLHGYALAFTENFSFGRFYGTLLSFIVLLVASLAVLWKAIQA